MDKQGNLVHLENEPNLEAIFDQSLSEPQSFKPEELPDNWTVGQYTYYRVVDESPTFDESGALMMTGALDRKLGEFRALGVKVLDYGRRWGFWIFKTMTPQ